MKPCPFCGTAPEAYQYESVYIIKCPSCVTVELFEDIKHKEDVIAEWNTRKSAQGHSQDQPPMNVFKNAVGTWQYSYNDDNGLNQHSEEFIDEVQAIKVKGQHVLPESTVGMKNYITCDIYEDKYVPMGFSKDLKTAQELAKKHGQVVCKLVPINEDKQ